MLIGVIHPGSGLGDSLFSYVATRVRAADLGVDFGFVGKEFFKGASFMNLDWGKEHDVYYLLNAETGEVMPSTRFDDFPNKAKLLPTIKLDKPYYDPEFNFIPDGSVIDGYGAQDIRYFEHRLDEVREWLKVESTTRDWEGVINIRGGEYRGVPEVFLPREYWVEAMDKFNPMPQWRIHTDDLQLADDWFPKISAMKDIEQNWKALRFAKNAIISNSAFAIIPRLLAHLDNFDVVTIAPKYWAGRNVGEWRRPGNYYKKFDYV